MIIQLLPNCVLTTKREARAIFEPLNGLQELMVIYGVGLMGRGAHEGLCLRADRAPAPRGELLGRLCCLLPSLSRIGTASITECLA